MNVRLLPTGIELSKAQVQLLTEALQAQENAKVDISFGYTTSIRLTFNYWRRATTKESWASQIVTITAIWKGGKWYYGGIRYANGFASRVDNLGTVIGDIREIGKKRETYYTAQRRAEARRAKKATKTKVPA